VSRMFLSVFLFFFSSRRRHTRCYRDWSSDVCSSDLEGQLRCTQCPATFPILRSMPRFVSSDEYAASFGYQWNQFDKLQLDKFMRNDLSRERFYATTGWPEHLEGQRVLEAGCGMGRFNQ